MIPAIYALVGLCNILIAMAQEKLILALPERDGDVIPGVVEFLFYLLLWPVQLLFALFVGVHALTEWLLGRIAP